MNRGKAAKIAMAAITATAIPNFCPTDSFFEVVAFDSSLRFVAAAKVAIGIVEEGLLINEGPSLVLGADSLSGVVLAAADSRSGMEAVLVGNAGTGRALVTVSNT